MPIKERVIRDTPSAHLGLLVCASDSDVESDGSLDAATKTILKDQRANLRQLLKMEHVERLRQVKVIDDVLACTARVLNPAAHAGNPPLYLKEVEDALGLVKQLESIVP